jgi:transposase
VPCSGADRNDNDEQRSATLSVFCGIDWAEDHHDVALVDRDGTLIAKRRISDDVSGYGLLLQLLADAGDDADAPIPVAIETSRGLLVACLRATGRKVFSINPMAVSRYRDRHSVAGKKSDAGDALVLAHILRTDLAAHRPLPADSELAQAIAVLARAQQDAVWERTCAHNKLRSLLREYYPGILAAFADKRDGLLRPEARAVLAAAPTPTAGAALTKSTQFAQHPDAATITSLPGLAALTGARLLAEIGDDRARFADARALKASPEQHRSPGPAARP